MFSIRRVDDLDSIFVKGDKNVQTSVFNYIYTRGECFFSKNIQIAHLS